MTKQTKDLAQTKSLYPPKTDWLQGGAKKCERISQYVFGVVKCAELKEVYGLKIKCLQAEIQLVNSDPEILKWLKSEALIKRAWQASSDAEKQQMQVYLDAASEKTGDLVDRDVIILNYQKVADFESELQNQLEKFKYIPNFSDTELKKSVSENECNKEKLYLSISKWFKYNFDISISKNDMDSIITRAGYKKSLKKIVLSGGKYTSILNAGNLLQQAYLYAFETLVALEKFSPVFIPVVLKDKYTKKKKEVAR